MVLEDGRVVEDAAFSQDEVRLLVKSLSSQEGRREQLLTQPNSRPLGFILHLLGLSAAQTVHGAGRYRATVEPSMEVD